jgi:glycosyltransferase involved in cell wall biosynthesis
VRLDRDLGVGSDIARILVIRQGRFPFDIRVRREVEALLSDGHNVDVLCVGRTSEPLLDRWQGARIVRLPIPHPRGGALGYLLEYGVFAAAAFLLASGLHLRRRYRLVQVHTMPDLLVFAALVPRLLGARVLLDLHETMPEFFATRFGRAPESVAVRAVGLAEQASIRFADRAITCTTLLKGAFVDRGASTEKIDVVLSSADESIFDTRRYPPQPRHPGRFTLITHGTVEEHVGIDTAIEALALLADEIPGLELQVYGNGSYGDDLQRLAETRGVGDRVQFQRDWVPIDQLVDALARADAGLVAMKRDAFRDLVLSNKMYEFITMRRPILMSRTRAVEEYFDAKCFAWFESDDPADLARAIRRLHDEPQWAQELVEHASRGNERYRWVHHRDHYLEIVRRILSEDDGARP